MKEMFEPLSRDSLYETVYRQLSLALIDGQLKPDDKLRIRPLALQLGVSPTPVRDAILRLVKERALVWRSPKDVRVPHMLRSQFQEVRAIRLRLEGLAARLAAEKRTAAEVERLQSILEENEAAIKRAEMIVAIRLNRLFHSTVAEMAALPVLHDMINNLWLRMGPIVASVYVSGGRKMISFHHEILKAIRNGDGDLAEEMIRADINTTAEILLSMDAILVEG